VIDFVPTHEHPVGSPTTDTDPLLPEAILPGTDLLVQVRPGRRWRASSRYVPHHHASHGQTHSPRPTNHDGTRTTRVTHHFHTARDRSPSLLFPRQSTLTSMHQSGFISRLQHSLKAVNFHPRAGIPPPCADGPSATGEMQRCPICRKLTLHCRIFSLRFRILRLNSISDHLIFGPFGKSDLPDKTE
jgi:hypothetical protein